MQIWRSLKVMGFSPGLILVIAAILALFFSFLSDFFTSKKEENKGKDRLSSLEPR